MRLSGGAWALSGCWLDQDRDRSAFPTPVAALWALCAVLEHNIFREGGKADAPDSQLCPPADKYAAYASHQNSWALGLHLVATAPHTGWAELQTVHTTHGPQGA